MKNNMFSSLLVEMKILIKLPLLQFGEESVLCETTAVSLSGLRLIQRQNMRIIRSLSTLIMTRLKFAAITIKNIIKRGDEQNRHLVLLFYKPIAFLFCLSIITLWDFKSHIETEVLI